MPIKTSIHRCNDNVQYIENLVQSMELNEENGFEIEYQNCYSTISDDQHVALLYACTDCLASHQEVEKIKTAAQKIPMVVALLDFTDENAKKYQDLNVKEVLPAKSISPKLFRRTLEMHAQSGQKDEHQMTVNQQLGALLDRIPFNLLMTDQEGKVVFSNQGGRAFIEEQESITINNAGTLTLSSPQENKALLDKIRKIASGDESEQHHSSLRYLLDDDQVVIIVLPLKGSAGRTGTAIFLRNEKEQAQLNEEVLKSLYGLTSAESKLSLLLTNGYSLSEIAEMNNVSQHTVRTQLKNIYAKTGINRQTDLIKAIITGPASLRSV